MVGVPFSTLFSSSTTTLNVSSLDLITEIAHKIIFDKTINKSAIYFINN